MRPRKYLSIYRLQLKTIFVDLIMTLKKQGGETHIHGGMVKNGGSSNDIDLYVEGIDYKELPQNIIIDGLPVRFSLALNKGEPFFKL